MIKKRILAFLLTAALTLSAAAPAYAIGDTDEDAPVTYADLAAYDAEDDGDSDALTLGDVLYILFRAAGMEDRQLGSKSDCVALADSLGMLDKDDYDADDVCTKEFLDQLTSNEGYTALVDALDSDTRKPLFVNGMAQPIFPFTSGAVEEGYSNEDSDIIRYCVYVETNYDTDGDGKLDLVKAVVQVPRAAAEGDYKAATIYEARPYITGCTNRGMGYDTADGYDMTKLYARPEARDSFLKTTTLEAADNAKSSDWYYYNPFESMMDYEDLDWYDYYLVRGYAVVECGGLGTRGSEGFETCGSDLEIDAFKCVIEWLSGERAAYTDKTSNIRIYADWSNGNVGMTGRSYAGTTQFGLATTGVKGLKTIVPVAGIASWYEYTNSQGISTRSSTAYTNTLAAYCAGRYLDSDAAVAAAESAGITDYVSSGDYASISDTYSDYLGELSNQQTRLNGDYASENETLDSNTWEIRDYTLNANKIQCPALIVHGINDYNVRTKEFQLMYNAFKEAGQNVKILLHQDGHLTPTYPAGNYVFDIGNSSYDEILNRWFSHYLCEVDNGAENMAAVTAQDSHDTNVWNTYDSWEAAKNVVFSIDTDSETTTTINSNYADLGVNSSNWQSKFTSGTTRGSVMYAQTVTAPMTVKGSIAVSFSALADNMPDASDTDLPIEERDALMVSAMLVDIAPEGETFPAFNTSGSYVPKTTLAEGGAWMGGGLPNYDLKELNASNVTYKVISRGWMDLCNPDADFDSNTASTRVALDSKTYQNYTIYLQSTVYEVEAGHTLALVIYAHEPGMARYTQNYQITIKNASVKAEIPVNEATASDIAASKADEATYSVTYTAENGTVTGSIESGASVTAGTQLTLTATADSGYSFDHWTVNGAEAGKDAQLIVTITDDTQIVAVFTKNGSSSGGSSSGSSSSRTYSVTVEDSQNGTVTASPKRAEKGDTVSVTASANSGYELGTISAKDANGNTLKLTDKGSGKYTFTMPASKVTVSAEFTAVQTTPAFADVASGAYYADAVDWAVKNGITNGKANGLFGSNDPCTRAQIVTFLWRAAGSPAPKTTVNPFSDVSAEAYYAKAVLWAVENGITNGTTATTFSPDAACTRAQCVTFLFRGAIANGLEAVTLQDLISGFSDAASLPGYAMPAMNWALANEIVQGNGGALMPNGTCTRAQIVTFLYRANQSK